MKSLQTVRLHALLERDGVEFTRRSTDQVSCLRVAGALGSGNKWDAAKYGTDEK